MRYEIIFGPIPAIFMLESFSFPVPFGSIIPNIVEIKSFPLGAFLGSRSADSDRIPADGPDPAGDPA
jgi:hypothetical protein